MTTATLNTPAMPILLTAAEAANILRVHPETIYRLRREGTIQGVTINSAIRFSTDEIARLAAAGCGQTRKPQPAASAVAVADEPTDTPE